MLDGATIGGAVPITKGLDGFSKVAQQVPSIRNLYGAGSTLANAVGIGAGAITSNDLDTGTVA